MARTRKPRVDLTPEQASELARMYGDWPGITTTELARRFGIARCSVAGIVERHGVPLRAGRPPMPPEQVDRVLELYRDRSLPVREIAELVGRDPSTVYRLVKQAGRTIERRGVGCYANHRRWYTHAPDLFADPLLDDELWLLGLLLADGTTDGRWTCVLRLAVSDRDGVEAARQAAGSDAPITTERTSGQSPSGGPCPDLARWAINSSEVVARLVGLGMRPAKSYRTDVAVPARVASSSSFWRGLIDGDGTICWNRSRSGDRTGRRQAWLQVLGGEALLQQWATFVTETIGGPAPRVRPKRGTRVLHVSVLAGSRAWHMLKLLYGSGGPALARKRTMAHTILAEDPPTPKPVPRAEVENALRALAGRGLAGLPERYVCPDTDVRLGGLVHKARRGQRPDLHALFAAYDPGWRTPAR